MTGTYTEITDLIAPSQAVAGAVVNVTINIKNITDADVHVAAVGTYDTELRFIDWLDSLIPAGETHSFSGSFVMPNKDVIIHAYSHYEDPEGNWYYDDEVTMDVTLGAGVADWAAPLITVALLMAMVAMVAPALKEGFS